LKKIYHQEGSDPLTRYYALVALGKIADSTFAAGLVSDYNSAENKSGFNGISLALYYLCTDGKISADKVRPVLENELYSSSSRSFEAAFCLYRIGPVPGEKDLLIRTLKRILDGRIVSAVTVKPVSYILGCLRKLKYFPYNEEMIKQLKDIDDFQVQVEFVRALSYCSFNSEDQLDTYLDFLDSDNKNISREAAVSVKNLKFQSLLRDYLYLKLSEKLHNDTDMEKYTRGELLMSYLNLFPDDFNNVLLKYFEGKISSEYAYKICSLYPGSEEALKILSEKYYAESLPNKLTILESILNFDQAIPAVRDILLSALSSKQAPLISVAADGMDSLFVNSQEDTLAGIIRAQVSSHLNDADFIEALMSLENAAAKISAGLKNKVINSLSGSNLYSVRKFIAELKGKSFRTVLKPIDDFNNYWERAFKYSKAEIVTDKGSFTISFLPEFAPVTVGSFCYLAEKDFFNGIPFHRVVPGFVIQGGDPTGTGWGGPGYEIISEFSPFNYSTGVVGMASAGKDTEGSQWFVTTGNYPHLDGRYTIFAEVLKGLDVVEHITQGTRIKEVNLIR
jgi:cyclophilin family peptidyl-prolyl cis-trans isomerase